MVRVRSWGSIERAAFRERCVTALDAKARRKGFNTVKDANEYAPDTIALTAEIVSAYVGNNSIKAGELTGLISEVHAALLAIAVGSVEVPSEPLSPALPIKKSVTPDLIFCLEDGKGFKSLKRHLRTKYGLSPSEYREKWGLPDDYPMVAPNYAAARSNLARGFGLGRKREERDPFGMALQTGGRSSLSRRDEPTANRPGPSSALDRGRLSETHDPHPLLQIGRSDHARLTKMAEAVLESLPDVAEFLLAELERSVVVDDDAVRSNVVRMGSRVTFREGRSAQTRSVSLVFPEEADISQSKISILTPIGAALIGLAEGQTITFSPPAGAERELTVLAVSR